MAAIDKVYVSTYEQYLQFKEWCKEQPKLSDKYGEKTSITTYLCNCWNKDDFTKERPIFCAPYYVDAYVIRNCPFDFIQKELMINYGYVDQKGVDERYKIVMERRGIPGEPGKDLCWWLTKDDFKIVNGIIIYPENENSTYMKIKRNELYTFPESNIEYTIGKHFKCVKHPKYRFNTPYKQKSWFIDVFVPDGLPFMWYIEKHNSWEFPYDFVITDDKSSNAFCKTIKALKRLIIKWKLPIGTIVRATGRYTNETYLFKVKK